MSLTGEQLLTGFSKFINDYWASTTTSDGNASGSTVIDTKIGRHGDEGEREKYLRLLSPGTGGGDVNTYEVRRVKSSTSSTGAMSVQPAFPNQTEAEDGYELHKYDPDLKFRALDSARLALSQDLFIIKRDDSITADGLTNEFDIPSTIRNGPFVAVVETELETETGWNVLGTPLFDSVTNGDWAASNVNVVATLYPQTDTDRLIPKYGNTCTKLTYTDNGADAAYKQTVSAMDDDFTAASAAGRTLVLSMWVYSNGDFVSGLGPRIRFITDSTTNNSARHSGNGWELLTVTATVPNNNATTFEVRIKFDTDASDNSQIAYVERGWLMYGDKLPNIYHEEEATKVIRDDTIQKFKLPFIPARGKQLRLIGRGSLSSIGDGSAAATATMEVDEESAQLLYAKAAELLFSREFLDIQMPQLVAGRVTVAAGLGRQFKESTHKPANKARIVGPYY